MIPINTFWNLHQERRINEVEDRAIRADYSGKFADIKSEDVKVQYERMVLIVSALYELLIEKGITLENELSKKIDEIDSRDGICDGRKINPIIHCHKCGSGISRKFKKCLVCGTEFPNISEIEAL